MSPGGLALVAAESAKYGVRGRPPAHAMKAAPHQGSVQLPYLWGWVAGPEGPGIPRGRRAAEQVWVANVVTGQLAAGQSRLATLLEEWVGEASSRPTGGPPVGHRDNGGLLQATPELSLCGRGSALLWGRGGGKLPFLEVPRPPASEEHNTTAEQDAGEHQHGQHSRQDHAAAPCGDPVSVRIGVPMPGMPHGHGLVPTSTMAGRRPPPQHPSPAHASG